MQFRSVELDRIADRDPCQVTAATDLGPVEDDVATEASVRKVDPARELDKGEIGRLRECRFREARRNVELRAPEVGVVQKKALPKFT